MNNEHKSSCRVLTYAGPESALRAFRAIEELLKDSTSGLECIEVDFQESTLTVVGHELLLKRMGRESARATS